MTSSSAGTEVPQTDLPTTAGDAPAPRQEGAWSRAATPEHREKDAALQAWRAYFEATVLLQDRAERHLKEQVNLSLGDYNVLLLLSEAPGHRLRMGQLASQMVFSPSRLTYQVKTLEARGLVTRQPCSDDRRGSEAELTDAGRRVFRKAAAVHTRQVRQDFLDQLNEHETETLLQVFSRLGRSLEDTGS